MLNQRTDYIILTKNISLKWIFLVNVKGNSDFSRLVITRYLLTNWIFDDAISVSNSFEFTFFILFETLWNVLLCNLLLRTIYWSKKSLVYIAHSFDNKVESNSKIVDVQQQTYTINWNTSSNRSNQKYSSYR